MSTELDQAREIAERVARRVAAGSASTSATSAPAKPQTKSAVGAELAAVRAGLNDLQRKIAQLEAKVGSEGVDERRPAMTADMPPPRPVLITHSPWLAGVNAPYSHPSQEKFGVEEATVSELVDFFEKEKICSVEPGGKPCDHCAMCSSRGF